MYYRLNVLPRGGFPQQNETFHNVVPVITVASVVRLAVLLLLLSMNCVYEGFESPLICSVSAADVQTYLTSHISNFSDR